MNKLTLLLPDPELALARLGKKGSLRGGNHPGRSITRGRGRCSRPRRASAGCARTRTPRRPAMARRPPAAVTATMRAADSTSTAVPWSGGFSARDTAHGGSPSAGAGRRGGPRDDRARVLATARRVSLAHPRRPALLGMRALVAPPARLPPAPGAPRMRLARVFPRRTRATPDDALAYVGPPDLFAAADRIHVSVAFTYDKPAAEVLAEQWRHVAPVEVGGVAYGDPGADFVPGRYIKRGYTFTSRGCPRRCWFCSVWKRDPVPRLLPIQDGWNILDDNLLACPEPHVRAVFAMLARQGRRVGSTGTVAGSALPAGSRRSRCRIIRSSCSPPSARARYAFSPMIRATLLRRSPRPPAVCSTPALRARAMRCAATC